MLSAVHIKKSSLKDTAASHERDPAPSASALMMIRFIPITLGHGFVRIAPLSWAILVSRPRARPHSLASVVSLWCTQSVLHIGRVRVLQGAPDRSHPSCGHAH